MMKANLNEHKAGAGAGASVSDETNSIESSLVSYEAWYGKTCSYKLHINFSNGEFKKKSAEVMTRLHKLLRENPALRPLLAYYKKCHSLLPKRKVITVFICKSGNSFCMLKRVTLNKPALCCKV
jgi:hypothetical protein